MVPLMLQGYTPPLDGLIAAGYEADVSRDRSWLITGVIPAKHVEDHIFLSDDTCDQTRSVAFLLTLGVNPGGPGDSLFVTRCRSSGPQMKCRGTLAGPAIHDALPDP